MSSKMKQSHQKNQLSLEDIHRKINDVQSSILRPHSFIYCTEINNLLHSQVKTMNQGESVDAKPAPEHCTSLQNWKHWHKLNLNNSSISTLKQIHRPKMGWGRHLHQPHGAWWCQLQQLQWLKRAPPKKNTGATAGNQWCQLRGHMRH